MLIFSGTFKNMLYFYCAMYILPPDNCIYCKYVIDNVSDRPVYLQYIQYI